MFFGEAGPVEAAASAQKNRSRRTGFFGNVENRGRGQDFGGIGQLAWLPLPSLAPLPWELALPEPSRNGVPVEFGLPRLLADLPEPSWTGTPAPEPRLPWPLPPRAPAAKAEVPARRPALMRTVRTMDFVFIRPVQPRTRRTITGRR